MSARAGTASIVALVLQKNAGASAPADFVCWCVVCLELNHQLQNRHQYLLAVIFTPGPMVVAMEMVFRYWPLTVEGFAFSIAPISAL